MPPRPTLTVIGRRLDPEHHRLRDFLTRAAQPFVWLEADSADATRALEEIGATGLELPVVIDEGQAMAAASVGAARASSGRPTVRRRAPSTTWRSSARARQASRRRSTPPPTGSRPIVVERDLPGGQASHTSLIENFFGFPEGIGGAELARLAGRQAEGFGAELVMLRGVTGSRRTPEGFALDVDGGHQVRAPW